MLSLRLLNETIQLFSAPHFKFITCKQKNIQLIIVVSNRYIFISYLEFIH